MYLRTHENGVIVNGSVGCVTGFLDDLPLVDFGDDGEFAIEEFNFEIKDHNQQVMASRRQLPLMLAWASSAHKSQGLSIMTNVEMDLGTVFDWGQAYVMLSRVREPAQLSIKAFKPTAIRAHPKAVAFYKQYEAF